MIPYRRQQAIQSGAMSLISGDVTGGDVILVRRPGAAERTPETVLVANNVPGKRIVFTFDGFESEHSNDIPVSVVKFTDGPWRQRINGH